jgi:hypothetical protein
MFTGVVWVGFKSHKSFIAGAANGSRKSGTIGIA